MWHRDANNTGTQQHQTDCGLHDFTHKPRHEEISGCSGDRAAERTGVVGERGARVLHELMDFCWLAPRGSSARTQETDMR